MESKFETRFPDVDPEILELIPYTNGQDLRPPNLYRRSHLVSK
jgi:hypothetical protein